MTLCYSDYLMSSRFRLDPECSSIVGAQDFTIHLQYYSCGKS
jgi:hypothetical protein